MTFAHAWMHLENGKKIASNNWEPGIYIRKIIDGGENERVFRREGDSFSEVGFIDVKDLMGDWTTLS